MIDDKIKTLLGEFSFQIAVLQHQLEEANKKIAELEKKDE
jgi:hypothetical protein